MRIFIVIAAIATTAVIAFFAVGQYATDHFTGTLKNNQRFEVMAGENAYALGIRLEESGIVFSRYTFLWYLFHAQKTHQIVAGTYMLSGSLTVPEIAALITAGKTVSRDIKVTFPEGWTMDSMAERLTANSLPGADFLQLAEHPLTEWRTRYGFLSALPVNATLEGYLFPDTYQFAPEATGKDIVIALLQNFNKKFESLVKMQGAAGGIFDAKRYHDIVTLASIIEEEGRTQEERDMISDVFWKRLKIGQPLQSDATVNYIHGTTRLQPTLVDTAVDSPYNTYKNAGLPPGPISNPSLGSLRAAFFPRSNPYYYFLVDINTGETVYAQTFDEHIRNRTLHGL